MQNFGRFIQPPNLIANISGTAQDIQNRKTNSSTAIPPAGQGETLGIAIEGFFTGNGYATCILVDNTRLIKNVK